MTHLIRDAFLTHALVLLPELEHYWPDLEYSDPEFLTLGVRRNNTFPPSRIGVTFDRKDSAHSHIVLAHTER